MISDKKAIFLRFPSNVFILSLLISFIGITNIASASTVTRPNLYLVQLLWLSIAVSVALFIAFIHTRSIHRLSDVLYWGVNILLLSVVFVGTTIKGATRWIDLGFFNLQPSELAKITVILAMAKYLSKNYNGAAFTLREILQPLNITRPILVSILWIFTIINVSINKPELIENWSMAFTIFIFTITLFLIILWFFLCFYMPNKLVMVKKSLFAPVDLLVLPFLLVLTQPDLGTSLMLLSVPCMMLLYYGIKPGSILISACLAVAMIVMSWNFVLHDYQKQRFLTFLNPEADIRGAGYHSAQSIIAIGSGQALGKGYQEGTQTQLSFLPENHTDFVFSVLAEEWGFIGVLIVLLLYFSLISAMIFIAAKSTSQFSSLVAFGTAGMVFVHTIANIGMVTGLLPVVGVTLPFMSYGGSSLITQFIAIGLCMNCAIWRDN